ncbi:hypothetical protein HYX09_01460 [Candidatus Woesearchaeota archaeon]|nr:hypothetical protein [Candidatus Woesearchaeota archaeon]
MFKINRNYYMSVALISIILVISACAKGGSTTVGAPTSPFIGGTSGLVINFEEDSPPPEVTDQAFPFKAIVRLANEGEDGVLRNDVKVQLKGFSPKDFNVADGSLGDADLTVSPITDDLRAKTRDSEGKIIEGGTTFVEIPANKNLQSKQATGNTPYTFRADVCYMYRTTAQARLCVLADMINIGTDELCNPNQAKSSFSSSSPVQVTNFRESVIGQQKVSFSFDVVHSGNGDIYQIVTTTNPYCPRDVTTDRRANLDKVKVTVDASDLDDATDGTDTGLECHLEGEGTTGPSVGYVRLIGGKRTVTCTLGLSGQHASDFEKIINIYLDFNYDENKETQVLVKHLVS